MPRTSWQDMARYRVVVPPKPIAQALTQQTRLLVDRINANTHTSHALAALRDALLPKLISGEVRVKPAEPEFSEAKRTPAEEARARAYVRHLRPNDRYRRR